MGALPLVPVAAYNSLHISTAVFVIGMWRVNSYGGKYDSRAACAWL